MSGYCKGESVVPHTYHHQVMDEVRCHIQERMEHAELGSEARV
jgi:hypothetical protein